MYRDHTLAALVDLLVRRKVFLYHACQYGDFSSYLQLGGIPSRERIERAGLFVTPFTTDGTDRENGVWDKVFVNLEDFGKGFADGRNAVPTPYGPVTVRLHPRALLSAVDVAVCLRSAGARGFDRAAESLRTVPEADRLFYRPANARGGTALLKFRPGLKEAFGPGAEAVEVSCTYPDGVLPFEHALDVVVDPYRINGTELASHVEAALRRAGVALQVYKRGGARADAEYDLLLQAVRARTPTLGELAETLPDAGLAGWAREIQARGGILAWNFTRYADYLRAGTLQRLPAARPSVRVAPYEYAPGLGDDDYGYEDEGYDLDAYLEYDSEAELLAEELDEYREDWARADDEGWFYDDEDDDDGLDGDDDDDAWD